MDADFRVWRLGPRALGVSGQLDTLGVLPLERAFADVSEAGDGPIFLDMSHLSFIDPEGINGLIRGLRSLREGCLVLHGVRGEVRKTLDSFALHRLHRLHVIPCEERAPGADVRRLSAHR